MNVAETRPMKGIPEGRYMDMVNTVFIGTVHLVSIYSVIYMVQYFSWATLGFGVFYAIMCGLSITAGYHRLFSHPTYKANAFVRAVWLFFGAASVQNSALKWSADHRIHHSKTDTDEDPYNIRRGFWWAHIGWVLFAGGSSIRYDLVGDLQKDPLVRFQDKHYIAMIVASILVVPALCGMLWGDPVGAVLVAGLLRLVIQWHSTFSVNSFTHMFGTRPYCKKGTARDSWIVALITFGEGYHNYHHRFPLDYRNGVRWFQFDPTKWSVWGMSKMGFTWDLRRTPEDRRLEVLERVKAAG